MDTLSDRIEIIRKEMLIAQQVWQHPIKLIAVTKTQPPKLINSLVQTGVLAIGENRVQEILDKSPDLNPDFCIHFIGQLQTNKVKYIMDNVCQIQSVDRLSLAQEIDRRALKAGTRMNVLVQVSPAGEPQKGGVPKDEAEAFIKRISILPGIKVQGLMAVMPLSNDEALLNTLFKQMRCLFERLRKQAIQNVDMTELSMGMSHDYRLALKNGANVIRVGTALFGTRR